MTQQFRNRSERPTTSLTDITFAEETSIDSIKADRPEVGDVLGTVTVNKDAEEQEMPLEKQNRASQAVYGAVHRTNWPITYTPVPPVLLEGRDDIDKPFVMRLKENVWVSINAHCKALGVTKSEWVREAIFRQLYEEQQFFMKGEKR